MIDGVDCGAIGLKTLRMAMSYIPQDPVLLSGPLHFNLDPTGSHSDEATSSVDMHTDAVIQQELRHGVLGSATQIIVAHRLATIADSDLICVLDRGHVAEMAAPCELLAKPASAYAQ